MNVRLVSLHYLISAPLQLTTVYLVYHNVKLALTIFLVYRALETQLGVSVVPRINATAHKDLIAICRSNLIA